tara:strand:- start:25806 stop:27623 length:1818 start_codon:yes stop_codon:yes gene_type:complete
MDRFGRIGSDLAKYSGLQLAGKQLAQAGKSLGWLMVILGTLHYILKIYVPQFAIYSLVFSLSLFVLAAYALAQRTEKDRIAILIPMLIFCIWYFIFSGNVSLTFWLWFGPVIAAIVVLPIILTHGQSTTPEVLGFLPVLFLFLDVGLLPWLVQTYDITPTILLENLMLFMPWWAFFGIMTMPTDSSSKGYTNFLINLTRVIGIFFIVFTFIIPAVPNLGHETTFTDELPGLGEITEASQEYQKRAAKTEHPFFANMACIISDAENLEQCLKDRQQRREFEYYCRFEENIKKTSSKFEACVAEQKKKREKELLVAGQSDKDIKEPTKATFKVSEFFPEKQYLSSPSESLNFRYPINFILENPRSQSIDIVFSCKFKSKTKSKAEIIGNIDVGEGPENGRDTIKATGTQTKRTIACTPSEILDGRYQLVYLAEMQNVQSGSRLKRAFIGDKDLEWKEEWIDKIKKASFSKREHLSRGPEEFARINFAFGNFLEDPFIEYKAEKQNSLILSSTIENLDGGKITRIGSYSINLLGFQPQPGQADCLSGFNYPTSKTRQKTIPLPTCLMHKIPIEFQNPTDFIIKEFTAEVIYDYQKERSMDVEVKKLKT